MRTAYCVMRKEEQGTRRPSYAVRITQYAVCPLSLAHRQQLVHVVRLQVLFERVERLLFGEGDAQADVDVVEAVRPPVARVHDAEARLLEPLDRVGDAPGLPPPAERHLAVMHPREEVRQVVEDPEC